MCPQETAHELRQADVSGIVSQRSTSPDCPCLVDNLVATLRCLQLPGGWSRHVDQKGILNCALGVIDSEKVIQEAFNQGKVQLTPQLEAVHTDLTPRPDLHLRIAKRLLRSGVDDRITAQQFRFARSLILKEPDILPQVVVELCFEVGRHSARSSQFDAATEYFELGIWVIENSNDPDTWWKSGLTYRLTLSIFSAAAEANQAAGKVERALDLISSVQEHGRSVHDKIIAFTTKVTILGQAGDRDEAIDTGVQVLRQMGHHLPRNPSWRHVLITSVRLRLVLGERSKESILRIPDMTDESVIVVMRMLHLVFTYSFVTRPMLMLTSAVHMVKLTLQHGLCVVSAPAFAAFALLLLVSRNPIKGEIFLQLALDLQERYGRKEWLPRTYALVYGLARGRSRSSLDHLDEAYHVGLETGDFEFAFIARQLHIYAKLRQGKVLTEIISDISELLDEARARNQMYRANLVSLDLHFTQLLAHGDTEWDPSMLTHKCGVSKQWSSPSQDHLKVAFYNIELSYFFGEHEHVVELSKKLPMRIRSVLRSHPLFSDVGLFIEISRLIIQRKVGNRISSFLPCTFLDCLKKSALARPEWYSRGLFLIQAERAWTQGKLRRAKFHYTNSAACCRSPLEHALVHQRFGNFWLESQRYPEAAEHMTKSLEAFSAMGANALAKRMKKEILFVNRMDHGGNYRSPWY